MSRHRSLVATSLYAFAGFNWSFMMSRHQLKSSAAFNWSFMMSPPQSLVATSAYVFGGFTGCFWCRDFSPLSRQQLELHQLHLSKPVIASRRFSCRDINLCRDITMLSRHHSFSFCSILSCLSYDPCRDLHQISFNFPDVATS